MQYMLDTDICIYLIKQKPSQVMTRFQQQAIGNMIAGHAKSISATLVTNNAREFKRVSGLKIENWA
jgi:predicted nucleic acid-binding protein